MKVTEWDRRRVLVKVVEIVAEMGGVSLNEWGRSEWGGGVRESLPARQTFAFLFHLADMFQLRLTELHLALTVAHYPGLSSHLCSKTRVAWLLCVRRQTHTAWGPDDTRINKDAEIFMIFHWLENVKMNHERERHEYFTAKTLCCSLTTKYDRRRWWRRRNAEVFPVLNQVGWDILSGSGLKVPRRVSKMVKQTQSHHS